MDPGLLIPRAYSPNPGLGHVRICVLLRSHHCPGLLVCNWRPRQQNIMDHPGESSACLGAGGSDGRSPPGGGLSQCWVRSPVGVSCPSSKAERPTAARGSRGRRLTDTVPAWFSRGCSAFSSAITPFLETSSPTSLPVPPAPARGQSPSPTTPQDWLSPPGRGRGAGGGSRCPV